MKSEKIFKGKTEGFAHRTIECKECEELLSAAFDCASDAMVLLDRSGRIIRINRVVTDLGGFEEKDLVGKGFRILRLFSPMDLAGIAADFARVLRGATTPAREVEIKTKRGNLRIEIRGSPVKSGGRIVGVLGILRDVTERKKAEDALKISEEIFRAIFDNVNDGILLADVKTKKFYTGNNTICQMLGYRLEEIKNLRITDIHPKENLPYVIGQFERQARKEISVAKDIPMKRKDGRVFYADVNSSPVTLAGRTYLLGVFRDITEHKKILGELEKKNKEIERSKVGLESKIEDHERFSKLSVGRELKMIELKKRIKELEGKLKGK